MRQRLHRAALELGSCRHGRISSLRSSRGSITRRSIQISATPSTTEPTGEQDASIGLPANGEADTPDARFEVIGSSSSLLAVSLSASQNLYTRRGTLVGLIGKAENAVSTLSMLEPFRRAVLGIPFVYQRVSSTSPLSLLISTKLPSSSFAVVHLDGTTDWMIAQRRALLAWTGHSLSVKPTINRRMSVAHWGNSEITGRGLVSLAGQGNIYQIRLKAGEEYVAHPAHVLAYTISQYPPHPYRLKASTLRFQIPGISLNNLIPDTKFFRVMRETATWKFITNMMFNLRTWSRRTIWGDRLFMRFQGPTTLLIQSRGSRISDVLTTRDVNEIADSPSGAMYSALTSPIRKEEGHGSSQESGVDRKAPEPTVRMKVASVNKDGKVEFKDAE